MGRGCPSVQQCGLHFFSPASQTFPAPAPLALTVHKPGRELGSSALKPPPRRVSCLGVSSEYLDHLTPCMARAHVISCLCHLSAGELWPPWSCCLPHCALAWLVASSLPVPTARALAPLFISGTASLPKARSWLTDATLGHLSPAHLPIVFYTTQDVLACCVVV